MSCGISYFWNSACSGVAEGNQCSNNIQHGIEVQGDATPLLEGNICSNNAGNGINYRQTSKGTAIMNECFKNTIGIYVENTAKPDIIGNKCYDNIEGGVVFQSR